MRGLSETCVRSVLALWKIAMRVNLESQIRELELKREQLENAEGVWTLTALKTIVILYNSLKLTSSHLITLVGNRTCNTEGR